MLCLTIEGEGVFRRVPLVFGRLRIGSALDNDVVVESPYVSRHHLLLELGADGVTLEDLGSRNGTHVGGRRIFREQITPPAAFRLGSGVNVRIGSVDSDDVELAFALASATVASSPRAATDEDGLARGSLAARMLSLLAATAPPHRPDALLALAISSSAARGGAILRGPTPASNAVSWNAANVVVLALHGDLDIDDGLLGSCGRAEPRTWTLHGTTWFARADHVGTAVALACEHEHPEPTLLDAAALLGLPAAGRPPGEARTLTLPAGALAPTSRVMRELHTRMASCLTSELPVLLLGETGCGKEVHARAIHASSARAAGPFQAVNSSAIPETLLEALLFGTEQGVASGVRRQPGLIREAEGGTFFLDEIGEMSPALQAKLLRVLDEHQVHPIGATRPVPVDVRFIAATHRHLEADVANGRFRADLLHRLRGHVYTIPPLRARLGDVPAHVESAVRSECVRSGRNVAGVSLKAMRALQEHSWPGNIRELDSLVRAAVHFVPDGAAITREDLAAVGFGGSPARATGRLLEDRLDELRRQALEEALDAAEGNLSEVARMLGLSRGGLRLLMKRLGVGRG